MWQLLRMHSTGALNGSSKMPTHGKVPLKKATDKQNQIKLVITNQGGSETNKIPKGGANCVFSGTSFFKEKHQGICPKATSSSPTPCHTRALVWKEAQLGISTLVF